MTHQHELEMSISHQEFYRLLPRALRNLDYQIANNEINLSYINGSIRIQAKIKQERKIASLVLPVLHVSISFVDISSKEIEQFLIRFKRAYQRGGG